MRIFGGANCGDKFGEVASMKMWLRIEESDRGRVPGARDETARPERPLRGGAVGDEREDVGYDFGGKENFAGGRLDVRCGGWRGGR
jgi:hypothetical protein